MQVRLPFTSHLLQCDFHRNRSLCSSWFHERVVYTWTLFQFKVCIMTLGRTLVRVKHYLFSKKKYLFCFKKVPKKVPFLVQNGAFRDLKMTHFWSKKGSLWWKKGSTITFLTKRPLFHTILRSPNAPFWTKKGTLLGTFFEKKRYLFFFQKVVFEAQNSY